MGQAWWRRPSAFPLALLVMTLCIIIVGGTIRINDAGESCPDWPQCFGTWDFDVSADEQGAYWAENPDEDRFTWCSIIAIRRLKDFPNGSTDYLVGIIAIPVLLNAILAKENESREYGKTVYRSTVSLSQVLTYWSLKHWSVR